MDAEQLSAVTVSPRADSFARAASERHRQGGLTAADRLFDIGFAVLLLPFALVLGTLIALAVFIDSPGPVLYRSRRVGRGGVPFNMVKFRKMRDDAGDGSLTLDGDERFTPIGRVLSITRLDELPQLWNVLRGEMRLVGPRPELECFVHEFAGPYAEILTVTPGITGPSQLRFVNERLMLAGGDPAEGYRNSVLPAKIAIDVNYVRTRSARRDVMIIGQTIALPALLAFSGSAGGGPSRVRAWLPTAASVLLLATLVFTASSLLA